MLWKNKIRPQPMFEILQVVRNIEHEGKDVVHLEIGDTSGFTNESLKSYISNALIDIPFSYSPSAGELELRTAAAKLFSEDINKEVAVHQVGVAPANAIIIESLASVTSEGDVVLIPDPGFPTYELASIFLGLNIVSYGVFENGVPSIESISTIKEKLKGRKPAALVINNPSNPLGHVFPWSEFTDLMDLAMNSDSTIILDETYLHLTFGSSTVGPLLSDSPRIIRLRSLSKEHAAPGLRIGYYMASPENVQTMSDFSSMVFSCLPSFVQVGAARYLLSPDSKKFTLKINNELRQRFDHFNDLSNQYGHPQKYFPNSGFYGFIGVRGGDQVFKILLEEFGVAVCPGSAFGPRGSDAIRVSLAGDKEDVNTGLVRVMNGIQAMKKG
jgi:aspartate/methionine/tyrosine aminotransferase